MREKENIFEREETERVYVSARGSVRMCERVERKREKKVCNRKRKSGIYLVTKPHKALNCTNLPCLLFFSLFQKPRDRTNHPMNNTSVVGGRMLPTAASTSSGGGSITARSGGSSTAGESSNGGVSEETKAIFLEKVNNQNCIDSFCV